jgi:diacylglycerol kinase (ATP)
MTELSQFETPLDIARLAYPQAASRRTLLVCTNRRAGSGVLLSQVEGIISRLEERGYVLQCERNLDTVHRVSNELHTSGQLRAVIAIGGDGTASAVRARAPLEVPLLVIPMGTENLLAGRYLRQSTQPTAVLDVIENGVVIELDMGWANDKPFLLMISAGFDAEVIRRLHESRRGNIRRVTYLLPILSVMKSYAFRPMRIYWDETDAQKADPTLCRWLFGFNLPLYALGLPIAPDAVGTDSLLNVCAFERGSIWSIVRYLWHVTRQTYHDLPDAVLRQTRQFRVASADDTEIAFQLDGDFCGMLPVDVRVVPKQLRLLVSRETAERLGFALPPLPVNLS